MLKFITKTVNATTRLVVGKSNPALTARTHELDAVMAKRHDLKKAKELDIAQDTLLVLELDRIMGRTSTPKATKLDMEQATSVAYLQADVEETTSSVDASYDEWTDVVEMYWISTADLNTLEKNDEQVGNKIATYIAHTNNLKSGKKGLLTKKQIRDMSMYCFDALEENVKLGHKDSLSINEFLVANAEKTGINFMNALVVAFVNAKD